MMGFDNSRTRARRIYIMTSRDTNAWTGPQ